METTFLFNPEEINEVFRLVVTYFTLAFATSVGCFARGMIFPRENTFGQNIGFSLFSAIITFAITVFLKEQVTIAYTFVISMALGFFIPALKDSLKGLNPFKLLIKIIKGTKGVAGSAIDELEKEFSEDSKENNIGPKSGDRFT